MQKRPPSQYTSPAKLAAHKAGLAGEAAKAASASPLAPSGPAAAARTRRATRSMARAAFDEAQSADESIEESAALNAEAEAEAEAAFTAPEAEAEAENEVQASSAATSSGTVSPEVRDDSFVEDAAAAAEAPKARSNIITGTKSFIKPARSPAKARTKPINVKSLQCAEKQRQAEERKK